MRYALVVLSYVVFSAAPAFAQDWRATEITGAVAVITPGQAAREVAAQDILPVGAVVTTGRNARAVFSNGAARATLSANSRLTLAPSENGFTRFVQDLGVVLFQVDRQHDPHFEVRTSLVAAVVKGTTFTVSVEPDEHRVFVAEGTVEVSAIEGGDAELVSGGAIAEVERDAPDRVERALRSLQGSAAPATALDYAALSGGLLRNRTDANDDAAPTGRGSDPAGLVLADASDPAGHADAPATGDDQGAGGASNDDDANNGHGNDDDGDDGNPGSGGDGDGGASDADDGNNGHGNDDDGDDDSNPGRGHGHDDEDDHHGGE